MDKYQRRNGAVKPKRLHDLVVKRISPSICSLLEGQPRSKIMIPRALERPNEPSMIGLTEPIIAKFVNSRYTEKDVFLAGTIIAIVSILQSPSYPGDFLPLERKVLTARECEVLHWIARGKRDAEIARILGIATKTVSKHVEHLLRKLGAETRTGAVRAGQERMQSVPVTLLTFSECKTFRI